MAPPTRHAIATLRNITGADEDEAVRLLEVHDGNLTEAVDAHLNKRDKKPHAASSVQGHNDLMDLDDPIDTESSDTSHSRLSASRRVTEVPTAVDVAGSAANQGPAFHMVFTDKGMLFLRKTDKGMLLLSNPYHGIDDFSDGEEGIDIEEAMLRAAIEASKREDGGSVLDSSPGPVIDQMSHDFEDELACAVSLSMKVAEQEKAPHELGVHIAGQSSTPEERQCATKVSQNDSDKNSSLYRLPPHLPSSRLTAQRLLREEQDEAYLAALEADKEKEMKEAQTAFEKERHQEEANCRKLLEEEECERILAAKEASLPHEPSPDNENVVTLLVRMPDGSRHGRRFMQSDQLQLLFDYIDIGRVVKPGTYRLVRLYPRCAFTVEEHGSLTLSELGLTRNEALYLEQI